MTDVASKNLYALLGNDSDQDSDKEPAPPTKAVDKSNARKGKRDAPATGPVETRGGGSERGGRGGRRGDFQGSERAFRDREAGSTNNRGKPVDDGVRSDRHSNQIGGGRGQNAGSDARGRGRGGRGGRGGGGRGDRQNRGFPNEHVKQAEQSWGAQTGDAEWNDEQAGEAIAKAEEKAEGGAGEWNAGDIPPPLDGEAPPNGEATVDASEAKAFEEKEEEDKSRSYADYLAEQAEKKLKLGTTEFNARKANEGTKSKKEWEKAKPIEKSAAGTEDFMHLGKEKAKRERAKKEKNVLDVEIRYAEPADTRGGGRGGRGRGGSDRGSFRGERGGGRGGGRGRGERGGYRGERGGRNNGPGGGSGGRAVNVEDQSAFPSLGGS